MTTISYELAKELKDAGWPQPEFGGYVKGDWTFDATLPIEFGADVNAYAPSLSELIAACPQETEKGQFILTTHRGGGRWFAMYWNDYDHIECATPEEAVARLWLKLKNNE